MTTIKQKRSLTGDVIYPLVIDPRYAVDIDNLSDWAQYEALTSSGLEMSAMCVFGERSVRKSASCSGSPTASAKYGFHVSGRRSMNVNRS